MKIKVTIADQTFEVEVGDLQARPILATIDGETFEVSPETAAAAAAPAASARPAPVAAPAASRAPAAGGGGKQVVAPIPGVIISITVKPGDEVKVGQELLILEAMKMKNAIRATRPGKIGNIKVAIGDHVRHGQVLVELSE